MRKNQSLTDSKKVRIKSIAYDTIYAVTNGRVKPSKHLQLGLALKSLTGSRKVIDIMNRYGVVPSYNVIEGIETELTFTAASTSRLLPDGLHSVPFLHTGLAWDNFDLFVETINGKDTLHDTVGIAYQDEYANPMTGMQRIPSSEEPVPGTRRRRTFEASQLTIEPYYKRPKITKQSMVPLNDPRRFEIPATLKKSQELDFLWTLNLKLKPKETQMWVGFNYDHTIETLARQKVCYLPQINQSPTSNAVVMHTLKMSQRVAEECDQQYISVTYDLAIATKALAIQFEESPRFDNVFIQLGTFHIELSFFKVYTDTSF